ncbi:MAG TPA: hypothetical protein VM166_05420 [Gemmatimonadaceae bacterium]|nr:hypothetical protein [Gemmatimonadaceae bacterium]
MSSLPRIRPELRQHKLDDQLLVYDAANERVHLLDPATACVLTLLQEGGWTDEGIRSEAALRLEVEPSDALIPLAIEELRAAGLLAEATLSAPLGDVKRREMLKKLAVGGMAAVLVPAIATLTANSAYAATLLADCSPCTKNSDCASGQCNKGVCIVSSGCLAMGALCGPAGDPNCLCCSGDCMSDGMCG